MKPRRQATNPRTRPRRITLTIPLPEGDTLPEDLVGAVIVKARRRRGNAKHIRAVIMPIGVDSARK